MASNVTIELEVLRDRILRQQRAIENYAGIIPDSASVIGSIRSLSHSVDSVERSVALLRERAALDKSVLESQITDLKAHLIASQSENASLRVQLSKSQEDFIAAIRDGDYRISQLKDAKIIEIDSWKEAYATQMRAYVTEKMEENKANLKREFAAANDVAISKLEAEYRQHLDSLNRSLEAALTSEATHIRISEQQRSRADTLEAENAKLRLEISDLRASLSQANANAATATENGRTLADEVLKLRNLLEAERAAHEDLQDMQARRNKSEIEAEVLNRTLAIRSAADVHSAELFTLKTTLEATIRSLEDSVNEWKNRYNVAISRADHAEAVLRDIDRQLSPVSSPRASVALAMARRALSSSYTAPSPISSPTVRPLSPSRTSTLRSISPSPSSYNTFSRTLYSTSPRSQPSAGSLAAPIVSAPSSIRATSPSRSPTSASYLGSTVSNLNTLTPGAVALMSSPVGKTSLAPRLFSPSQVRSPRSLSSQRLGETVISPIASFPPVSPVSLSTSALSATAKLAHAKAHAAQVAADIAAACDSATSAVLASESI